jgi:hypothetical protein
VAYTNFSCQAGLSKTIWEQEFIAQHLAGVDVTQFPLGQASGCRFAHHKSRSGLLGQLARFLGSAHQRSQNIL